MTKRIITVIALIWTTCFLIGASSHAREIWTFGWNVRPFMPEAFNWYWTALLPLDLAAAFLIWWKRRWGVLLGLFIMISDVMINGYSLLIANYQQIFEFNAFTLQFIFLIFVLLTAPLLWRTSKPAI